MRIGILTFHKSINNGAVIQCYSLSKKIQEIFPNHEVEVIDYHMPKIDDLYSVSYAKLFSGDLKAKLYGLYTLLKQPSYIKHLRQREYAFKSVGGYLPLSPHSIYQNDADELFSYINSRYDVVIAGSDAIWNYVVRGYPNPYFLSEQVTCIKMTYAASCYGMNYENISATQRNEVKKILDTYNFIGTRDEESNIFLKSIGCLVEPSHTCDPTVFLDVNDLPVKEGEIIAKLTERGFDFQRRTIAVMGTDKLCRYVKSMYSSDSQIVSLYNYCPSADVNLHDLTPYEWAFVFRYFTVTITTFFHGTLLSLRNGTPVVAIALINEFSEVHTTKVEDVLDRLNLEENYYKIIDYTDVEVKYQLKKKIDYYLNNNVSETIIDRMNKEAETSTIFFKALGKIVNNG